ncbi:MAG: hypothetical protein PHI11_04220 [Gallionella sp.]|nr:hypothetical protein [Gallionella sp.]
MKDKHEKKDDSPDWDEFFERKLKSLSTREIEEIIARALGEAVDATYQVEIKTINFEPVQDAFSSDSTELKILIRKKPEKLPF